MAAAAPRGGPRSARIAWPWKGRGDAARPGRRIFRARTLLIAAGGLLALLFCLDRLFPPPLPAGGGGGAVVLAADGTPLRAFADRDGVWRYPVTLDQVSPHYLEALITYEDRWFRRHPGVNPFALLRAGGQWLANGRVVSGGSTLSMQVARILDPHPRTAGGKLRQGLRALQLEWRFTKDQILTLYLNHAPFGGTIEGVEAASWAYLGKPARSLSRAEAALLAVLPQAPSRLRPDRHPEAARAARDKVLARLAARHVWTDADVADARIEAVVSRRLQPPMSAALLAQRLRAEAPDQARITSTLDAGLQRVLEQRLAAYFARLPERTSAALLVVDNASLEARAYVGSLEFADAARLGHVDMVRATRSPGSTLKPFLYGLAIDDGLLHSESLLVDAPQSFGDYRPANFDPAFNGPVSVAEALRLSLNVPAVDVLDRLGPERFAARLAHAGLTLRLPRGSKPNLSIILGGTGTRLEELVGAYAALNREGLAGAVRYRADAPRQDRRLLSPGAAWIVREILEQHGRPGQREDSFDTSGRPRVAWKTGTSYGFRDAWALGGTARYTVGVWVGRPDGTPLPGQYGAITALPLLFEVVDSLPRGSGDSRRSAPPASVRKLEICWPLGLPPDPAAPALCHEKREALALAGVLPPTLPERESRLWGSGRLALELDEGTGQRLSASCSRTHARRRVEVARWPGLAYPWLPAATRRASAIPALAPDCAPDALAAMETLRIDGPGDGARLARAPGSPHAPTLRLRAIGTDSRVRWLVNGRLAGESRGGRPWTHAFDEPGEQRITALADTGAWAELTLRVLR
ncbi:penicillin-binding protein 1C [Arenimonas terrae]|uniref:peptidoglycan glycosyltransferase n=1 Tax=Arenimonas terrae TaxID=2546226 RepID=A0A5C4RU12_9GAMM|nr:penicillin-binding protein 1C [Arenimonas terrae]TNJ34454.1 penicillin-binding protein 1C [Arenimonas terrae]